MHSLLALDKKLVSHEDNFPKILFIMNWIEALVGRVPEIGNPI